MSIDMEDLDGAVAQDMMVDAAARAAREPEFAERFEQAARLSFRARVTFRVAVARAGRRGDEPVWDADALLQEVGRRVALAAFAGGGRLL